MKTLSRLLIVVFTVFVLITAISFSVHAFEIRLRPAVTTSEESVRLADIALLAGNSSGHLSANTDALAEIELHRFTGDEREHRLSYEAIERAIRAEYTGPLVLVGSSVLVTRQTSRISRQQMLDAIQAHFRKNFPNAVFEVNLRSLPVDRTYFGGNISFAVVSRGTQEAQSGPFAAELIALSGANGEKELGRISFNGTIRVPGRVPVAAHNLARGRTLRSGDVRYIDLADVGRERVLRLEDISGRRILEDIPEGMRLEREQFERPILVRRGMRVTVVWKREGVHIEAEAIAVDEGREGDVVRLRNSHSGREFSARVGENPGRVYTDG